MCTVFVELRGEVTVNDPYGKRKKRIGPGVVKMFEARSPVGLDDPESQWLVLPSSSIGAARGFLLRAGKLVDEPKELREERLARAKAVLPTLLGKTVAISRKTGKPKADRGVRSRVPVCAGMMNTDTALKPLRVPAKSNGVPISPQAYSRRRPPVQVQVQA